MPSMSDAQNSDEKKNSPPERPASAPLPTAPGEVQPALKKTVSMPSYFPKAQLQPIVELSELHTFDPLTIPEEDKRLRAWLWTKMTIREGNYIKGSKDVNDLTLQKLFEIIDDYVATPSRNMAVFANAAENALAVKITIILSMILLLPFTLLAFGVIYVQVHRKREKEKEFLLYDHLVAEEHVAVAHQPPNLSPTQKIAAHAENINEVLESNKDLLTKIMHELYPGKYKSLEINHGFLALKEKDKGTPTTVAGKIDRFFTEESGKHLSKAFWLVFLYAMAWWLAFMVHFWITGATVGAVLLSPLVSGLLFGLPLLPLVVIFAIKISNYFSREKVNAKDAKDAIKAITAHQTEKTMILKYLLLLKNDAKKAEDLKTALLQQQPDLAAVAEEASLPKIDLNRYKDIEITADDLNNNDFNKAWLTAQDEDKNHRNKNLFRGTLATLVTYFILISIIQWVFAIQVMTNIFNMAFFLTPLGIVLNFSVALAFAITNTVLIYLPAKEKTEARTFYLERMKTVIDQKIMEIVKKEAILKFLKTRLDTLIKQFNFAANDTINKKLLNIELCLFEGVLKNEWLTADPAAEGAIADANQPSVKNRSLATRFADWLTSKRFFQWLFVDHDKTVMNLTVFVGRFGTGLLLIRLLLPEGSFFYTIGVSSGLAMWPTILLIGLIVGILYASMRLSHYKRTENLEGANEKLALLDANNACLDQLIDYDEKRIALIEAHFKQQSDAGSRASSDSILSATDVRDQPTPPVEGNRPSPPPLVAAASVSPLTGHGAASQFSPAPRPPEMPAPVIAEQEARSASPPIGLGS